jgi:hypothetical protein
MTRIDPCHLEHPGSAYMRMSRAHKKGTFGALYSKLILITLVFLRRALSGVADRSFMHYNRRLDNLMG